MLFSPLDKSGARNLFWSFLKIQYLREKPYLYSNMLYCMMTQYLTQYLACATALYENKNTEYEKKGDCSQFHFQWLKLSPHNQGDTLMMALMLLC